MHPDLAPEKLLAAYAQGIFPMADERNDVHWVTADPRAIIELDGLKVSRSLRAIYKRGVFHVTINRDFDAVITACADRAEGTWISTDIKKAYRRLHGLGFAHSVEGRLDGELVGGLYGVAIGGAFFGESMFHSTDNASKVALIRLVERMRERGFALLDVQFMTEHLRSLGAVEISAVEYKARLNRAVAMPCSFGDEPGERFSKRGEDIE